LEFLRDFPGQSSDGGHGNRPARPLSWNTELLSVWGQTWHEWIIHGVRCN
jgi:hypothetical protein